MRTYVSTADQEIVQDCCIARVIRILKEAHEDCQGATFSSVGVDALIAAWEALQESRMPAKEGSQEFLALLDEAIKAQENDHELHLTKAQVGIWFEHLEISMAPSIDALIYKLNTWIHHPLSPKSGAVSYHPLDFEMDRTKDYSIGLLFDGSGKIVPGPQMDLDGIDGLAKRLFFFMVATTEKLEAWKAARKGGKLAFPEVCTMRVLSSFSNTPNKLRELQHPQLLTFNKLEKALNKNRGVDLTAQDVSTVLEALGPIARPESKVGPESPSSIRT
jgi:hypothetical protein